MEDSSSATPEQQLQHIQLPLGRETCASTEQSLHPSRMQLVKYVEHRPWNWMGLLSSLSQYCREEHFGQVHSDEEIEVSSSGGRTGNGTSEDFVASDCIQTVPEGVSLDLHEARPQVIPHGPSTTEGSPQQQSCGIESHSSGQESGSTSTQVSNTSQMSCGIPELHSGGGSHGSPVGEESHSSEMSCSAQEPCGSTDSHGSPVSSEPELKATESNTDMQPPSKRQRLMDETTTANCTSDKAIQFPPAEDIVSDGYLTVFQALPRECARQHPLIPNVPPCQAQGDQSDPSDGEDPPDNEGTMLIKAPGRQLPFSNHTPPQTLLDEVRPAVSLELENQLVPEETCQEYYSDQSLYSDMDKMAAKADQPPSFMDVGAIPNSMQSTCFPPSNLHPGCFRQPTRGNLISVMLEFF